MTKLKKIRLLLGMTQKEVAKKLGITQAMYCYIENGKRNPSPQLAKKIEKLFGLSMLFND
jgi:transcriptional regulator with XRE-family HTH domain